MSGAGSSVEPLDTDLDEMRAQEAAMTREIKPLSSPADCESCQDGTAAVCLLAWSDAISGEESEPYLCQRCLDREFRDARLIAGIDALRARLAEVETIAFGEAGVQAAKLQAIRNLFRAAAPTGDDRG